MLFKLKEFYKKEKFHPSFVSIFINPSYIIRKGLFRGVSSNAKYMKGIMLDFGCGCKPYKNLLNVQEYIGLDIKESGHDHTKERINVFYDGKKIPFGDNHFDAVFSSEVFEHIFNLDEILNELHRVMKPGANILITVPFVWDEHEIPYDFARYTSYGIKYLLESKGFQIIKIEKTTNYMETIFQMWNTYISQYVLPSTPCLKIILNPLFIAPTTMLGILLSKILPDNRNLYHNNIVVAKKLE
jgi:SAM-dependent methyltransferase